MSFLGRITDYIVFRVCLAVLAISSPLLAVANYILPASLKTPLVPLIAIGLASAVCRTARDAGPDHVFGRGRVDHERAYEYLRSRDI
jgi:hypothetical protein